MKLSYKRSKYDMNNKAIKKLKCLICGKETENIFDKFEVFKSFTLFSKMK